MLRNYKIGRAAVLACKSAHKKLEIRTFVIKLVVYKLTQKPTHTYSIRYRRRRNNSELANSKHPKSQVWWIRTREFGSNCPRRWRTTIIWPPWDMLYLSRMDLRRQRSMRLSMCYLMVIFPLLVRVLMLFECWNAQKNLTLYSDVKSDRICIHWIQRKSLWVVIWMPAIMEVDCRRASILLQHFFWQWPKNPRILIWKICLLCGGLMIVRTLTINSSWRILHSSLCQQFQVLERSSLFVCTDLIYNLCIVLSTNVLVYWLHD